MRDIKTWLIIGLAAVIIFLLLFQPSRPDEGKQTYLDSVKVLQSDKATLQALQATIISEAREREKKDSSKLAASLNEISRLRAKATTAVQNIPVRVMEENPEIGYALAAQQDVIEKQAVLIDTLQNQLQFERNVREQLTALHYDTDKINAQLQEMADMRIVKLEKDLRKERRKGRLLKVVAIIGSVAAFIGGSQL